tara:strand:+ start:21560 stop:21919 length:360 start_codon:yes stop_codon:yes gene_type:complete
MKTLLTILLTFFLFILIWIASGFFITKLNNSPDTINYLLMLGVPGFASYLSLCSTYNFNNINRKVVFSSFTLIISLLVIIGLIINFTQPVEEPIAASIQLLSAIIGCVFFYYKEIKIIE